MHRYTTDKVVAPAPTSWGLDPAAATQPQLHPYHDTTAHDKPGSTSLRALAGAPTLTSTFVATHDTWSDAATAASPPLLDPPAASASAPAAAAARQPSGSAEKLAGITAQVEAAMPAAKGAAGAGGGKGRGPRSKYQELLDKGKQQLHEEAIAQHAARMAAHNNQLNKPGQHGLP